MVLAIRFLNTSARRGIVSRNGETNHRAIGERERALHQAFSESASAHNHAAVPVLDGAGEDFAGRSRILVDNYHQIDVAEFSVAVGALFVSWRASALGVHNQLVLVEEFVGNLGCNFQIAAAIIGYIEYQLLHSLLLQLCGGIHNLVV